MLKNNGKFVTAYYIPPQMRFVTVVYYVTKRDPDHIYEPDH